MNESASTDSNPRSSRAAVVLIGAGLAVLTAALYARVHSFEFVNFDDDVHVYANPHVVTGLTYENILWAFGIHGPSQWHPLAWLSHQLDYELFGSWAGGHHLMNVGLHIAAVVLLFLALRRLTCSIWKSAFVAALFAVHPLNVESVAWVSERRNVLCLCFGLAAVLAYSSYTRRGGTLRYLVVLVLFTLGLMAKPLLVTLPFAFLLLDYWPLRRFGHSQDVEPAPGLRKDSSPGHPTVESKTGTEDSSAGSSERSLGWLLIEKLPLLVLSVVSGILTIWCQQSAGAVASVDTLPLKVRLMNAPAAYAIYLRKLLWPDDLAVFYPHPGVVADDPTAALMMPAIVGAALLIAVTGFTLFHRKQHPCLLVGWCWFLGTLVPMIGLFQVGRQQLADRYAYLPMIGLLVATTWYATSGAGKGGHGKRKLLGRAGVLFVVAYASVSWTQLSHWRDSVALFGRALEVTERNSWAHNNLGLALHYRGRSHSAVEQFLLALRIDPEYALAQYNLGFVLHETGRRDQAMYRFQQAIRLAPDYLDARLRLGAALAETGRVDESITQFRQALEIAPEHADARLNLGIAQAAKGETSEAISQFRQVLERNPTHVKAHCQMGETLVEAAELATAEQHFAQAVQLAPDDPRGHTGLGTIALLRGRRDEAVRHFREALRRAPNDVRVQQNLRNALKN